MHGPSRPEPCAAHRPVPSFLPTSAPIQRAAGASRREAQPAERGMALRTGFLTPQHRLKYGGDVQAAEALRHARSSGVLAVVRLSAANSTELGSLVAATVQSLEGAGQEVQLVAGARP